QRRHRIRTRRRRRLTCSPRVYASGGLRLHLRHSFHRSPTPRPGGRPRKESVAKARSVKLDAVRRALAAGASTAVIVGTTSTGCGSDNNLHGLKAPAGPVNCDGKAALTAEGSTAQQNAIALFNLDWAQLCPGKQLAYNPSGWAAGREQFIAHHVDFAASNSPLIRDKIEPAAQRCGRNPAWHLPMVF